MLLDVKTDSIWNNDEVCFDQWQEARVQLNISGQLQLSPHNCGLYYLSGTGGTTVWSLENVDSPLSFTLPPLTTPLYIHSVHRYIVYINKVYTDIVYIYIVFIDTYCT